ncbi:AAA family ATPase [Microvirga makkahensis]|uniref:AAA family ATPase n=1 Tax=Microvirga makkahensis TaxID=1128670 RepID=A0A7X3MVG1_9HYPH|nr:AAA family ATPase [Microvirga makkahensis]MXQ13976.1 AAA family ATPase [Microvirga makkahensis]
MIIKRFEVTGLPGHADRPLVRRLHPDLNIITGRNGSGKTMLLKLLWYITSGNIEHATREVPFTRATIETDEYTITVNRITSSQSKIEILRGGEKFVFEDMFDDESGTMYDAEGEANTFVKEFGSSVFFPTFRRIEGGFSLTSARPGALFPGRTSRARGEIEEALSQLSRRLTVEKHTFVASISTVDIVGLLMRQYTEMSELSNNLQKINSENIIEQIKAYKRDNYLEGKENIKEHSARAEEVIDSIRSVIENMDRERAAILAPLDAVRALVEKLFQHSGIRLGARLSFGDAANAVSSEALSAGEKQMLSFICYNAFYRDSFIFIDEPELSLHVDWQRQLFPIMRSQGTSNQFIIATHSPFIYSKYPEKEIMISPDRGDTAEID